MHDPSRMRRRQAVGDLHGQIEQLARAVNGRNRRAVHKLHHQVAWGFRRCSDIVDLADVGMIQSRHRARLAFESLRKSRLRHFDGDDAIEARVAGLEDFAHATRPDGRDDFVRPQACSGIQGHWLHFPTGARWRR